MGFLVKYRIYFDRNKTIYTRLTIIIIIIVIIIRLTILINMEKNYVWISIAKFAKLNSVRRPVLEASQAPSLVKR